MSVSHLVYDQRISIIPNVTPIMKEDKFQPFDPADPHFKALINLGIINTEAVFMTNEPDVMQRQVKGDASEAGLIKFFEPVQPIMEHRQKSPVVYKVPFNSSNKWMASIVKQKDSDKLMLMLKGAPERIVAMCDKMYSQNKIIPLNKELNEELEQLNS